MNLILIEQLDFIDACLVRLEGRRARHILEVLGSKIGDRLTIGALDGPIGVGEVAGIDGEVVTLNVSLGSTPPRPRVTVILAMVRPQIMKRTLEHLATMGTRRVMLVGARRVEKAYFGQRLFDEDEYKKYLKLGLEQACDTWLPEVTIHRQFKPFIEDVLPEHLTDDKVKIIAHPKGFERPSEPIAAEQEVFLAIGPEGGWVSYEVERFRELGFQLLSFGPRILRVETALPYLFGRLGL